MVEKLTEDLDKLEIKNIEIKYNSETYNLANSNGTKLNVEKKGFDYQTSSFSKKKKNNKINLW